MAAMPSSSLQKQVSNLHDRLIRENEDRNSPPPSSLGPGLKRPKPCKLL